MAKNDKLKVLVNLPEGFFKTPELKPLFKRLGEYATLRKRSHNTPDEIEKDVIWAEAIIMWAWPDLSPEMLEKAKDLKYVGHLNASANSAIAELDAGIAVSEARHGWSASVAEMALTLILAGMRKTSQYHMDMRAGKEAWVEDIPADIDPHERNLTGRSIGVVGFGGIGQRLAELLAPFHPDLRAYDPYLPAKVAKEKGAKLVEMDELVKESEIVVLCAASTPETENIMSRKLIKSFRKGGLLVNVGRSSLVDMDALAERLEKDDMYAMLDVFDQEPLEKNSPFRKFKNAYLTPHRAGATLESACKIVSMCIEDLEAHFAGKRRKYVVTKDMFKRMG